MKYDIPMLRACITSFFLTLGAIWIIVFSYVSPTIFATGSDRPHWWNIQSVDTMKYSRDLSREKRKDPSFDTVIDQQIDNIANAGATHVAIATPYDEEFTPVLMRWVVSARKHNLKVWFRGNFSGWEKWFDYPAITRDEHTAKLTDFISRHKELFKEGDIFTPCPECENGGPGDPRVTNDISGHRLFLIHEYDLATQAFRKIGVNVGVGYYSMNYDVARIIMDKPTTAALGGIVTIDHYVQDPEKMMRDVRALAQSSGGKIFLGEFGAPIPDIHGKMSEAEQRLWLSTALSLLATESSIAGVNYWVNVGGSTELWDKNGNGREAVAALRQTFIPKTIGAKIVDQFNSPIANVEITSAYKKSISDQSGRFILPYLADEQVIRLTKGDHIDRTVNIEEINPETDIIIERKDITVIDRIMGYFRALFSNIRKVD